MVLSLQPVQDGARVTPSVGAWRDALHADPLLQQLRRVARGINVDTSIMDTAEDIRARISTAPEAPSQLAESLQQSLQEPHPMFKLKPMPKPPPTACAPPRCLPPARRHLQSEEERRPRRRGRASWAWSL